jgi:hypothetical protein
VPLLSALAHPAEPDRPDLLRTVVFYNTTTSTSGSLAHVDGLSKRTANQLDHRWTTGDVTPGPDISVPHDKLPGNHHARVLTSKSPDASTGVNSADDLPRRFARLVAAFARCPPAGADRSEHRALRINPQPCARHVPRWTQSIMSVIRRSRPALGGCSGLPRLADRPDRGARERQCGSATGDPRQSRRCVRQPCFETRDVIRPLGVPVSVNTTRTSGDRRVTEGGPDRGIRSGPQLLMYGQLPARLDTPVLPRIVPVRATAAVPVRWTVRVFAPCLSLALGQRVVLSPEPVRWRRGRLQLGIDRVTGRGDA